MNGYDQSNGVVPSAAVLDELSQYQASILQSFGGGGGGAWSGSNSMSAVGQSMVPPPSTPPQPQVPITKVDGTPATLSSRGKRIGRPPGSRTRNRRDDAADDVRHEHGNKGKKKGPFPFVACPKCGQIIFLNGGNFRMHLKRCTPETYQQVYASEENGGEKVTLKEALEKLNLTATFPNDIEYKEHERQLTERKKHRRRSTRSGDDVDESDEDAGSDDEDLDELISDKRHREQKRSRKNDASAPSTPSTRTSSRSSNPSTPANTPIAAHQMPGISVITPQPQQQILQQFTMYQPQQAATVVHRYHPQQQQQHHHTHANALLVRQQQANALFQRKRGLLTPQHFLERGEHLNHSWENTLVVQSLQRYTRNAAYLGEIFSTHFTLDFDKDANAIINGADFGSEENNKAVLAALAYHLEDRAAVKHEIRERLEAKRAQADDDLPQIERQLLTEQLEVAKKQFAESMHQLQNPPPLIHLLNKQQQQQQREQQRTMRGRLGVFDLEDEDMTATTTTATTTNTLQQQQQQDEDQEDELITAAAAAAGPTMDKGKKVISNNNNNNNSNSNDSNNNREQQRPSGGGPRFTKETSTVVRQVDPRSPMTPTDAHFLGGLFAAAAAAAAVAAKQQPHRDNGSNNGTGTGSSSSSNQDEQNASASAAPLQQQQQQQQPQKQLRLISL